MLLYKQIELVLEDLGIKLSVHIRFGFRLTHKTTKTLISKLSKLTQLLLSKYLDINDFLLTIAIYCKNDTITQPYWLSFTSSRNMMRKFRQLVTQLPLRSIVHYSPQQAISQVKLVSKRLHNRPFSKTVRHLIQGDLEV